MSKHYLAKIQCEANPLILDYDVLEEKIFFGDARNSLSQTWTFFLVDLRDGDICFRIQNKKCGKYIQDGENGIILSDQDLESASIWQQFRQKDVFQFRNRQTLNFLGIKDNMPTSQKEGSKFLILWEFNVGNSVNYPLPLYSPFLIGIDGFKKSGKSSIAKDLGRHLVYPVSKILSLDDYIDCSGHLSSLIMKVFLSDVEEELAIKRNLKSFIIVEGTDIFKNTKFFHQCDFCIFVGCDKMTLVGRWNDPAFESVIWPQCVHDGMKRHKNSFLVNGALQLRQNLLSIGERFNRKILERSIYHDSLTGTWDVYQMLKKSDAEGYRNVLFDKILGMVFGTAFGGAKGTPYEFSDYKKIQFLRENRDRLKLTEKWSCGTYHFLSVFHSISNLKGINPKDIAGELLKDFLEKKPDDISRWGAVTVDSLKKLKDKKTYLESGDPFSDGCGALGKMIPLVFHATQQNIDIGSITKEIIEVTGITHASPICKYASQMFSYFTSLIFNHPDILFDPLKRRETLQHIIQYSQTLERNYEFAFDSCIKPLEEFKLNFDQLKDDEKLISYLPNKTNCLHSLCVVIGIILGTPPSIHSLLRACYLGGDVETNGALVGGILGGSFGLSIFDGVEELENLDQKEYLFTRSTDIFEMYKGIKKPSTPTGTPTGFFSKLFNLEGRK